LEEETKLAHFVSLLVLAFAVSLDSFGVGITYGMRKVIIPIRSIVIIALCSGMMIFIAMGIGEGITYFISERMAELLGGGILLVIGLWALYNITSSRDSQETPNHVPGEKEKKKKVWTIELKKLGIMIQILRTPMAADIDRSGVITSMEAFFLGVALALDAFGAGIGAALMGYSPWVTVVLISSMSCLFIFLGMRFGEYFSDRAWIKRVSYVPAILLITLGIMKMM
jgi:putative sporulation protein YtaF